MGVVIKLFVNVLKYTLFNLYFLIVTVPLILLKIYNNETMGNLFVQKRFDGKTVIVTGGNTGIGYETAQELAFRGARVILACKNVGSGYLAKAKIIKDTRNDDVEVYRLDLSSLWSVRNFVKEILEKEKRLDVIVFNASIGFIKDRQTKDDLSLVWQVNCLSPFLISNLLINHMKKSTSSKIIFLSSALHHFNFFDVNKINSENPPNCFTNHCNTKFATVLMANTMAGKLKGTGVTVNTANPGLVNVPLCRRVKNSFFQQILKLIVETYGKPVKQGAATTLTMTLDSQFETVSGSYFSDCKVSKCVSKKVNDTNLGSKLWEKFTTLVDLKEDEKLI